MNEQTKLDIEKAEQLQNLPCIQIAAATKSPHENYVHTSTPCVQATLIDMGWTKATREEILALYQ